MSEYVIFDVLDQQAPSDWRPLEVHVAECELCRAELEGLKQSMRAVYDGALPETPPPPPPNLAFLTKRAAPSRRLPAEKLADLLPPKAFVPAITIPFPLSLASALRAPAPARSSQPYMSVQYEQPRAHEDEPYITFDAKRTADDPPRAEVQVCVEWLDRDPFDQAGTRVVGEGPTTMERVTDSAGEAIFEDVPLEWIEELLFTIEPPQSSGST